MSPLCFPYSDRLKQRWSLALCKGKILQDWRQMAGDRAFFYSPCTPLSYGFCGCSIKQLKSSQRGRLLGGWDAELCSSSWPPAAAPLLLSQYFDSVNSFEGSALLFSCEVPRNFELLPHSPGPWEGSAGTSCHHTEQVTRSSKCKRGQWPRSGRFCSVYHQLKSDFCKLLLL